MALAIRSPCSYSLRKSGFLRYWSQLAFAQFVGAARFGHIRQVRVLGQCVAESLGDEDLSRRVRQVLDRPDHVGDLEVVVVDHAGQVIQARPVRPLDHVVLFAGPGELDVAADLIVEAALAFARHLQAHHGLPAFRLQAGGVGLGLGHPVPAVAGTAVSPVPPLRVRPPFPPVGQKSR